MAFEEQRASSVKRKRLSLGRSPRRLSFERRIRLLLYLLALPAVLLCALLLRQWHIDAAALSITLLIFAACWAFAVSFLMEQIIRPLQTLANVVSALREDDYSFRARGGRRNDALGDLAIEVNALAGMLQGQRSSAIEAMALLERVMKSMQSPVLAFDPDGRLKLLNAAAERTFNLTRHLAIDHTAKQLNLHHLVAMADDDLITLGTAQQASRWVVKRTTFRLRGVPHSLLVLSDVSAALREEERLAWERLIRVLGHEINNSLTPIKSIAGSLRDRLAATRRSSEDSDDFESGLEVIESRAESLNRFLQAYRQLMGLPAPKLKPVSVADLVKRVALLETRVNVIVRNSSDIVIPLDPDHIQQALINLLRNAAEASLSPDASGSAPPCVAVEWFTVGDEVVIAIRDNGSGLTNEDNLFVPFYTTKPGGTGIGLVLAQQIAEAHRGSVRLTNRINGPGCVAELRLPLRSSDL